MAIERARIVSRKVVIEFAQFMCTPFTSFRVSKAYVGNAFHLIAACSSNDILL